MENIENIEKMELFLSQLSEIEKMYQDEKAKDNLFNVFSALFKGNEEENLHSRFISYLLSPTSKHGMGNAFLKCFVQNILKLDDFDIEDCQVYPNEQDKSERYYIDILLINKKEKKAIIIENKIRAGDSNHSGAESEKTYPDKYQGQLERYYNTIKDGQKVKKQEDGTFVLESIEQEYKCEDIWVYYLNPYGSLPSDISLGMLTGYEKFSCISYSTEIRQWIQECIKITEERKTLNEILKHYLKILDKMTNNELSFPNREKLTEVIGNSDENLRNAKLFIDNFKHVKWYTVYHFWKDLGERFENVSVFPENENFEKRIGDVTHGCKPILHGITFEKGGKTFYVACDSQGLTYGIHKESGANIWEKFEYNGEPILFSDFSNETTFGLIRGVKRKDVIDEIVKKINQL
jgi:hypothetical protein